MSIQNTSAATQKGLSQVTSSVFHDSDADSARGYKLLALALVLTALAYLATLRFSFVYDDGSQIVLNPTLTSWKTLPWLFTSHSWKFLLPDWGGNYYRPLFMSWLLLNMKLLGLYAPAWHATTVLLHLIVTWLAFVVARQLFRNSTSAGFTALLFGLHPIHVEAVAWVSGVTETLMAAFVLAAFWAWVKAEREPERRFFYKAVSVVFYACSCLCKETGLLLPLVIVGYEVLKGHYERDWRGLLQAVWHAAPLWITAAVYMSVRAIVLRGLVHPVNEPLAEIVLTIPTIVWGYMRRLAWPLNLTVFYDTPPVTGVLEWRFWLPSIALVVASVLAWRLGKRSHLIGVALIWIFVFLAPALIGIVAFPPGEWVHDRYLYLPSFGFCVLLVHVIRQLPSKRDIFGFPAVPTMLTLMLASAMAFGTTLEEQYWTSDFLLFVHNVRVSPGSSWAKMHLANEYFRRGDLEDTERLYQESLRLDPNSFKTRVAYGLVLYYSNQFERADQELAKASVLGPGDSNPYFYQGMSRFNSGNFRGAEAAFREAIAKAPTRVRYHFWLGFALEKQGRLAEAKPEYQMELAQHPETDTLARQRLAELEAAQEHPLSPASQK